MLRKTTSVFALALFAGAISIGATNTSFAEASCTGEDCQTTAEVPESPMLTHEDKCIEARLNFERASWLEQQDAGNDEASGPGGATGWQQMAFEATKYAELERQRATFSRARAADSPDQAEFWNKQATESEFEAEQWQQAADRYLSKAESIREQAEQHHEAAMEALKDCSNKEASAETVESKPEVVVVEKPVVVRRAASTRKRVVVHTPVVADEPTLPAPIAPRRSNTNIHIGLGLDLGGIFGGRGHGRGGGRGDHEPDDPGHEDPTPEPDPDPGPRDDAADGGDDGTGDDIVDVPGAGAPPPGPVIPGLPTIDICESRPDFCTDGFPGIIGSGRLGGIPGLGESGRLGEIDPCTLGLPGCRTEGGGSGDRGETGEREETGGVPVDPGRLIPGGVWDPAHCARRPGGCPLIPGEVGSTSEALTAAEPDERSRTRRARILGPLDTERRVEKLKKRELRKAKMKRKRLERLKKRKLRKAKADRKRIERVKKRKIRQARTERKRAKRLEKRKLRQARTERKRAKRLEKRKLRQAKRKQRRAEKRNTRAKKRIAKKNRRNAQRKNRRLKKAQRKNNRRVRQQQRKQRAEQRSSRRSQESSERRRKKRQKRQSNRRVRAFKG